MSGNRFDETLERQREEKAHDDFEMALSARPGFFANAWDFESEGRELHLGISTTEFLKGTDAERLMLVLPDKLWFQWFDPSQLARWMYSVPDRYWLAVSVHSAGQVRVTVTHAQFRLCLDGHLRVKVKLSFDEEQGLAHFNEGGLPKSAEFDVVSSYPFGSVPSFQAPRTFLAQVSSHPQVKLLEPQEQVVDPPVASRTRSFSRRLSTSFRSLGQKKQTVSEARSGSFASQAF